MDFNLEQETLRIMGITYSSSVDGLVFRDVVFVSYCPHHCPGCHNPQTWDKKSGKTVSLAQVYQDLTKSRITNVTYSGGEPFEQASALRLLSLALRKYTKKNIWIYSGYTFEELIAQPEKKALLKLCDVLVDGRFDQTKTQLNLRFKGSTNQRILDVKKSLKENAPILYSLDD